MKAKKVPAGALQYVLVISVVIAIIVFAFISLLYLQKRLQLKNSLFTKAIQNVYVGFQYLEKKTIEYDIPKEQQFSRNDNEKTMLLKKRWGIFDIGIVSSTVQKERFQKIGLIGGNEDKRQALVLKENNQALVLVGNTKIIGNAYIPKLGIKTGNIAGDSYYGNRLLYGTSQPSSAMLPTIKNKHYIQKISSGNFLTDKMFFFELSEDLQKTQSFTQPTLLFQSSGVIALQNIQLTGNIIIQSSEKIVVSSSASLKDVILVAPEINIQKNTQGNFQVFASKSISVEENCYLIYPTALVLCDKDTEIPKSDVTNKIVIEKNCSVKGSILFLSEEETMDFKTQVIISKNSLVIGEVYCDKNLELLGAVHGCVYTNNFIANQTGSVYVNHIYNGEINSSKLAEQYVGIAIGKTQKVAQWLY